MEVALSRVSIRNLGLSGLTYPSEELIEEMSYLLNAYCEQLLIIGQAHTISKNKAIHVSDAELVSGTIVANWSKPSTSEECSRCNEFADARAGS